MIKFEDIQIGDIIVCDNIQFCCKQIIFIMKKDYSTVTTKNIQTKHSMLLSFIDFNNSNMFKNNSTWTYKLIKSK